MTEPNALRRRWLIPALGALLTILYYIVPWHAMGGASEAVGLPFLLAYVVFLPGHLLRRRFADGERDWLASLTRSALFGLAFCLVAVFLTALSGISVETFGLLLPVPIVALIVLSVLRPAPAPAARPARSGRRLTTALFAVFAVIVALRVLSTGTPVDYTKDTLDHVGYVREIVETGRSFPETAFYIEGGENGKDIRKGLLHTMYGYAARALNIDPLRLVNDLNAFLALFLILAVYAASLAFFGDRRVAALAGVLFVFCAAGGLETTTLRTAVFPNRFGMAFFLFFLVYSLAFLERQRWRDAVLAAVFAFAACAAHVFFAIAVLSAGLVIKLWKVCFPQQRAAVHVSRVVVLGAIIVFGILPYMIYRYLTSTPQANVLHTEVQGVVYVAGPLFIADPLIVLRWFGALGVVSILAIVPLWPRRGGNPALGYLIASYLTIPLVLFNPLLLPLLHKVFTYLVFRLSIICPFFILSAFFLVDTFDGWRRGGRIGFARGLSGALVLAAALGGLPLFGPNTLSTSAVQRERANSYVAWRDGLDYLASQLPRGSVIVSDPVTSYSVPAFTPHYVVSTLNQHAPPNDLRLEERVLAAREIVSPFTPMQRALDLLGDHEATHVVLNRRISSGLLPYYWALDDALFEKSKARFASQPQLFEKTYDNGGFVVFRWTGETSGPAATPPNPYRLARVPADFETVDRAAGEADLRAVRIGSARVERGGRLDVDLIWSSGREHRLGNYIVAIRFDHRDPGLPLGGRPFPKVARKLKERVTGERYRFRVHGMFQRGLLGPDTWAPEALMLNSNHVPIPLDLAAGEYVISVKLLAQANQPNYYVRDFFFDDDVYQGVPAGTVSVE